MSENTNKKSKLLSSILAVGLAASLIVGGGTYAYLHDSTDAAVNEFNTNQVKVELQETTGKEYDIIPGTSQTKDPTVTVTNTVDAYVFIEVEDATEGLVAYNIDDGWTELDGVDNVYYREVAADAEAKTFSVLKDNTVTYDAALENSDMLEDGELKDGVTLSFKAYAIQKDPFTSAYNAYYQSEDVTVVDTGDALATALASAEEGSVIVADDVTVEDKLTVSTQGVTITGGTYENGITVAASDVALDNITVTGAASSPAVNVANSVEDFTLTDSTIDTDVRTGLYVNGSGTVTLTGNEISSAYNGIELSQSSIIADGTTISDNVISGCSNNAINIYKVEEGATITIENNEMDGVNNGIRLSNYNNVEYTVNVYNNSFNNSTATSPYNGFILFEDTDTTGEQNNLTKITVNMSGNTADGSALVNDLNDTTANRAYYTCDDYTWIKSGSDYALNVSDNMPTVNFSE